MRTIIMTVGFSHTGKTSFGKRLAAKLPHAAILERDPIASMLNEHFSPVLRQDKINWAKHGHEKLKDRIFQMVLQEAIKDEELTIILTGCHARKSYRTETINHLKQRLPSSKIVMVYFDLDHNKILERIHESNKSTAVLTISKNFQEVIERQQKIFDIPTPDESDYFFTIENNQNADDVISRILEIVKK